VGLLKSNAKKLKLGLCQLRERFENLGIIHGQLSQNFPVNDNLGFQQTVSQTAVSYPVGAAGGVNSRDPDASHVAFAKLAAYVAVLPGLIARILGPLYGSAAKAFFSFCRLKKSVVSLADGRPALNSCHVLLSLKVR
jgi:hypothetical protein